MCMWRGGEVGCSVCGAGRVCMVYSEMKDD